MSPPSPRQPRRRPL